MDLESKYYYFYHSWDFVPYHTLSILKMYGKHKINLLKEKTCLIFHQNKGYFERIVILNQTRINCSFSSIDTIKCLFNCVIYRFLTITCYRYEILFSPGQLCISWVPSENQNFQEKSYDFFTTHLI